MIYGQFTNWKPQRMFEVREYCDRINLDKPDIFAVCKKEKIIPEGVETVE